MKKFSSEYVKNDELAKMAKYFINHICLNPRGLERVDVPANKVYIDVLLTVLKQDRLLRVTKALVLPVNVPIRLLITSKDVLHS